MLKATASGNPEETYQFEPMREECQNRESRLRMMDEQGVDQTIMYPGGWPLVAEEYVAAASSRCTPTPTRSTAT